MTRIVNFYSATEGDDQGRMLAFYGMRISKGWIIRADNWDDRKHNWFIRDTHNNLRITRILKCLVALGLENEARHFFMALKGLVESEPDSGISQTSIRYWTEAIES